MALPRLGCVVAAVMAPVLSGCGEPLGDPSPPAPPSRAKLRTLASAPKPIYWLGRKELGSELIDARRRSGKITFGYGSWSCSSGTCEPSGTVINGPRDVSALRYVGTDRADPHSCWTRIGYAAAVLLTCDPDGYPQELLVFTGSSAVSVTSLYAGRGEISARAVARRLRPFTGASLPLAAPKRLTCRQFRRLNRTYRRFAPEQMTPVGTCGR